MVYIEFNEDVLDGFTEASDFQQHDTTDRPNSATTHPENVRENGKMDDHTGTLSTALALFISEERSHNGEEIPNKPVTRLAEHLSFNTEVA